MCQKVVQKLTKKCAKKSAKKNSPKKRCPKKRCPKKNRPKIRCLESGRVRLLTLTQLKKKNNLPE